MAASCDRMSGEAFRIAQLLPSAETARELWVCDGISPARASWQFSHPQLVVVQPAVSNYKRKGRGESVCAVATGEAVEPRGRAARAM